MIVSESLGGDIDGTTTHHQAVPGGHEMIAVTGSEQRFHPRARLDQLPASHYDSNSAEDGSSVLAKQFHRLKELMKTAMDRLDPLGVDIPQLFPMMDDIRDQLATFFLWKEMLSEESEIALRFHRQASAIAAERTELYMEACEVADEARDLLFQSETPMWQRIDMLRGSFEAFRQRLLSNEQRETELIIRSVYEDIGVGD